MCRAWRFIPKPAICGRLNLVPAAAMSNTQALGALIYTRYVYIFQAAGMVLLTAMIGAIVLTHRQRPGTRRQDIGAQNARTPAQATSKVRVASGEGVEL